MILYKTMQIQINTNNILGSAYILNEALNIQYRIVIKINTFIKI